MRKSTLFILLLGLATPGYGQTWLEEFQWNNLSPVGVQSWTSAGNWIPPSSPPGNPNYPDDPGHVDMDPDSLASVVGANLSVALASDLQLQLGGSDVTIASLALGANNRTTTINGPGVLIFEHNEDNVVDTIPDPDSPGDTIDEFTCAFNCGQSLITSNGNSSGSNVINAVIGSSQSLDISGTRTLTLAGGFQEIPIDPMNGTIANNTVIRNRIGGPYDPSIPLENQPRLLITGPVTTVVDEITGVDGEPDEIPLQFNSGGSGTPEVLSAANSQTGQGFPSGIIDIPGGITGDGSILIGTTSRDDETLPLPTVVLYDNSHTGITRIARGNVILRHDNAFGTGVGRNASPANEVGSNLIVEPGPGETAQTVNRVLSNNMQIPHEWTVKGNHSLTLTGDNYATNSAGWVNLLPEGEELVLEGRQFAETGNIFTYDGTGTTRIKGQLRNHPDDMIDTGTDPNGGRPGGQVRKRGTGAVYVESSLNGNTNTLRIGDLEVDEARDATVIVEGGNLHFATVGDMGVTAGRVESRGGAIGLDDGTIVGPGSATLMSKLNNFDNRFIPFEGDVERFGDVDSGGLMLAPVDSAASLDFTGALANARDMSVAAPETGLTFTGSITPANSTYRLGGGSGTLTLNGTNQLTGANNLVVTNGGDYRNPNGEDRVMLGMVQLTGTNNYSGSTEISGKYQRTTQDQADRDSMTAGDVLLGGGSVEEIQYNGTTLAVTSLADGNSSIGTSTSAANLLIQGSTLRYEGAADSTNRLFTVGTHGATLDASGSGAIQFTNASALVMDVAEDRTGSYSAFTGDSLERVTNISHTDDLVIGMSISGGDIPADSVITEILSPTRVRISNQFNVFDFDNDVPITFGSTERVLALTGTNAGDNSLAAAINDAADGGVVAVEKSGPGRWILTGNNAYSGTTNVQQGELLINGTHSGGGNYTVDAGGLLGGDGSLTGNLMANGTVAPGGSIGTLSVIGDVTFADDSIFDVEVDVAMMTSDLLAIDGNLDLSGVGNALDVSLLGGSSAAGPFVIATYTGTLTGVFDNLSPSLNIDYGTGMNSHITISNISDMPTVTGDFNMDTVWDCADIDMLTAAIATGSTDLSFDMNGDGQITLADVTDATNGWLAVGGANNAGQTGGNAFLPGDADLDGFVNGQDFVIWNNNKFTTNDAWCNGDFNADGFVNGQDFVIWNNFKFQSSADGFDAVPEPTIGWIYLAVALMATRFTKRFTG